MTRTRPLVLAASLALAACSAVVDPDKIKPTGPATAAALCQEITAALVDRVVECLGVPRAWAQQGNDLLNCSTWDASIAAGRLAYDQFYGDACINLVRTASCALLFGGSGGGGPPGACGQALQGLVPAGGVCATSEDCSSGTYCNYTGACGGTCKAYASLNQKCVDVAGGFTQCAPGLNCVSDATPGTSTCLAPIPLAGVCQAGYGCADGLYCDRTAALPANWTCLTQQTSGKCSQKDACLWPSHCSGNNVSTTNLGDCKPVARESQSCQNGYDDCVGGTYCKTGGTPAVGVNGSCTIYPGPPTVCGQYGVEWIQCLGSYCNAAPPAQGACTPYIALGATCSATGPSDQCGPGNYCTVVALNVCAVACP